jgi:hypothetical protein
MFFLEPNHLEPKDPLRKDGPNDVGSEPFCWEETDALSDERLLFASHHGTSGRLDEKRLL